MRHLIAAHFGEAILAYDEESRVPIPRPSPSTAVAEFVEELRSAYLRLADQHAGRTSAVAIREDARDLLRRLRGTRT